MGILAKLEAIGEAAPTDEIWENAEMDYEFSEAKSLCETVGLKMSGLCVDSIASRLNRPITFTEFAVKLNELRNRSEDELSLCLLLHVPPEKSEAFESTDPFGAKVTTNFNSASYDIEEASKCLALDRARPVLCTSCASWKPLLTQLL
jgi:hypothetical protein